MAGAAASGGGGGAAPQRVGILAMEAYFPRSFVSQEELERFDGASAGKYTVGLGQAGLAFVTAREDVYSVALTATASLVRKARVSFADIGRLEVATETILDHSKAVKTVLMQLFAESGNSDVEGVDTMNACYAGTNALFNSLNWIESSAWDGRLALVVAADIAEYAAGPARPTGGAGAVAFLVGPNAPLVMERGCRASHMEHVYDFFKPNLSSPYPVVDGKFSNACYLRALDRCYQRFCAKFEAAHKTRFELARADFVVFHAPYNKLVQKSFGRLLYNDFVRAPSDPRFAALASGFGALTPEQSYADAALEKALVAMTADAYRAKVEPGTLLPREIGNTYTASLYAGLLSLVATQGAALAGRRVLMFSYGSGLASSLFSLVAPDDDATRAALERMREAAALRERLAARRRASPEEFSRCMAQREQLHDARGAFEPQEPVDSLFPGTFYLTRKDELGRRFYAQTPL